MSFSYFSINNRKILITKMSVVFLFCSYPRDLKVPCSVQRFVCSIPKFSQLISWQPICCRGGFRGMSSFPSIKSNVKSKTEMKIEANKYVFPTFISIKSRKVIIIKLSAVALIGGPWYLAVSSICFFDTKIMVNNVITL